MDLETLLYFGLIPLVASTIITYIVMKLKV